MTTRHWLRQLRHLFHPPLRVRHAFPHRALKAIAQAVKAAEAQHGGEIRVAIEGALDWPELQRRLTPRQRAVELFSQLRVWDTENNDGVLLYLLLADRAVEIVADRGIARKVGPEQWQAICAHMQPLLRQGRFEDAVMQGVREISALLAQHAGPPDPSRNDLPDWPVVVRR